VGGQSGNIRFIGPVKIGTAINRVLVARGTSIEVIGVDIISFEEIEEGIVTSTSSISTEG